MDSFLQGEPEAAGLIHAAIEDFSQEFALIIQRFLKLKEWKNTERIVIGGGFRASRIRGARYRPHDNHSGNAAAAGGPTFFARARLFCTAAVPLPLEAGQVFVLVEIGLLPR